MTNTIAVSDFVQRQTKDSPFSYYTGSWESLRGLTALCFGDEGKTVSGYREGVVLVSVPVLGFYSAIVTLGDGDVLTGTFERRQPGEDPRKSIKVDISGADRHPGSPQGGKQKAEHVNIVLYHKDVLDEDDGRSTDADWEIISINAAPTDEDVPIDPDTLIANHFELSGGTATKMSAEAFEAALKKSVLYWKDKAMVG